MATPAALKKVLAANPKAKALWDDLTAIAQRDFITWMGAAKQAETRQRRLESIPSRLLSGKRRPCCYAMVPLDLYSELDDNATAKATWKTLTPIERRDLVDWVGGDAGRIQKAIKLLTAGKKHP